MTNSKTLKTVLTLINSAFPAANAEIFTVFDCDDVAKKGIEIPDHHLTCLAPGLDSILDECGWYAFDSVYNTVRLFAGVEFELREEV